MSRQPDPYGGTSDSNDNEQYNQTNPGAFNNNQILNSQQQHQQTIPQIVHRDHPTSPTMMRNNSAGSSPLLRNNSADANYSPPRIPLNGASGYSNERPVHLRQRSFTTNANGSVQSHSDGDNSNPFRSPPRPYRAAMMDGSENGDSSENGHNSARDVRGDVAEWEPTQHHLFHEDDASRALKLSPPQSSRSSSHGGGGGNSRARFDLSTLTPEVLSSYERSKHAQEVDDALHTPDELGRREGHERKIIESSGFKGHGVSCGGLGNILALVLMVSALVMLFAGFPIYSFFHKNTLSNFGAVGMGGTNSTGQVPKIPGFRGLIDADTPSNVLSRTGFDGQAYQLVFSDEFNQDGRSFGVGQDPYWEAVNLHYWQTQDVEWYDPDSITTQDGYLAITLSKETNETSHGNGYLGGMLQSWNKFCFTGGYIEVAISLPGDTKASGLWPAAWTMGNLGRAGYGGSLDGNWPYSYETCDVGTLANQTDPRTGLPNVGPDNGDPYNFDAFSYLPGQRLSACTCPGENHPGPVKPDGSFVGRSSPEIDIFEAGINNRLKAGFISQSAQWAPFNPNYTYVNTSSATVKFSPGTVANSYRGGAFQQVTSGTTITDPSTYNSTTNFETYGFEYTPSYYNGFGTGSIAWTQGEQVTWKIHDSAMAANAESGSADRPITGEPLYILFNLGMSESFGFIDFEKLIFPAVMRVDYVRVYQPNDKVNVGCSPPLYPTSKYIADNLEAYENPNVTVLADMGQKFPKNRLIDKC